MKYSMIAIGGGKFRNEIPEANQISFHMVGGLFYQGKWIITHADLDEIRIITENMSRFSISANTDNFVINGTQWAERACVNQKDCSVAWLTWYESQPEHLFFMPRDFPNDPEYFRFHDAQYGIWNVSTKDTVLLGTCLRDTKMESIVKEVM